MHATADEEEPPPLSPPSPPLSPPLTPPMVPSDELEEEKVDVKDMDDVAEEEEEVDGKDMEVVVADDEDVDGKDIEDGMAVAAAGAIPAAGATVVVVVVVTGAGAVVLKICITPETILLIRPEPPVEGTATEDGNGPQAGLPG